MNPLVTKMISNKVVPNEIEEKGNEIGLEPKMDDQNDLENQTSEEKGNTLSTLQKKEVCTQQNVPAKCFKICYILCIRKPM